MADRGPSENIFLKSPMVTGNVKNENHKAEERSKKEENNYEVSKKEINKYNKEKGHVTKKKFENHMLKESEDKLVNSEGTVDKEMSPTTSSFGRETSLNRSPLSSTKLSSIHQEKNFKALPPKGETVSKYKFKKDVEKESGTFDLKKKMDELKKVKAFLEKDRKKFLCHNKEREEIKNQQDMKLLEQIANEKNISVNSLLPFKDKIIQRYMEIKKIERAEKIEQINNEINIISKLMREKVMIAPKESKWEDSLRKNTKTKSRFGFVERDLRKGLKKDTLKEMDRGKDYTDQTEDKEKPLEKSREEVEGEVERIEKIDGVSSSKNKEDKGDEIGSKLEYPSEASGDSEKRSGDGFIENRNMTQSSSIFDKESRTHVKVTRTSKEVVEEIDGQVSE